MTEVKQQDYWILLAWPAKRTERTADPEDEGIWGQQQPVFTTVGGVEELLYLLVFTSEEKARAYAEVAQPETPDLRIVKPLRISAEAICDYVFDGDPGGCLLLDRDPEEENPYILDVGYLLDDFSDWSEEEEE